MGKFKELLDSSKKETIDENAVVTLELINKITANLGKADISLLKRIASILETKETNESMFENAALSLDLVNKIISNLGKADVSTLKRISKMLETKEVTEGVSLDVKDFMKKFNEQFSLLTEDIKYSDINKDYVTRLESIGILISKFLKK